MAGPAHHRSRKENLTEPACAENDRQPHKEEGEGPGNPIQGFFSTSGASEELGLTANSSQAIALGTMQQYQSNQSDRREEPYALNNVRQHPTETLVNDKNAGGGLVTAQA